MKRNMASGLWMCAALMVLHVALPMKSMAGEPAASVVVPFDDWAPLREDAKESALKAVEELVIVNRILMRVFKIACEEFERDPSAETATKAALAYFALVGDKARLIAKFHGGMVIYTAALRKDIAEKEDQRALYNGCLRVAGQEVARLREAFRRAANERERERLTEQTAALVEQAETLTASLAQVRHTIETDQAELKTTADLQEELRHEHRLTATHLQTARYRLYSWTDRNNASSSVIAARSTISKAYPLLMSLRGGGPRPPQKSRAEALAQQSTVGDALQARARRLLEGDVPLSDLLRPEANGNGQHIPTPQR